MDYEKKYKEALGWMRDLYPSLHGMVKEDAEYYFPELKESEDEQIRKVLVGWFKRYKEQDTCGSEMFNGIPTDNILTWLEKQVEQKSAWSEEDMSKVQRICKYLNEAKKYYADITEVRECMDWLKSLKGRVGCEANCTTTKEWNESDKEEFQIAIDTLVKAGQHDSAHWLKSLKQRIGG